MPPQTITEKRFREGTGVKYMPSGNVRCHALGKTRVRAWREEHNDYETPLEELWPECQCPLTAVQGMFACHWHGGRTPSKTKPKDIFSVLPIDLAEKLRVLIQDPNYLTRRDDILVLKARQWELFEQLQQTMGAEEAWANVEEAIVALRSGDERSALLYLESAVKATDTTSETWNQIIKVDHILKDLTLTEVKTMKDLKLMATVDQVTALIQHIQQAIMDSAEKYIDDPVKQVLFLQRVSTAINGFANIRPVAIVEQLTASSSAESRNS